MHYILDEGISELKKSSQDSPNSHASSMYSDTNKSGSASDKSFNLMRHQAERDYRQMPVIPSEKYASILNKVGGANNNSSLRMFLEELKSDDNRPPSAYQGNGASFSRAAIHFSPSQPSIASSSNLEMIKMQEESFSKIHNDIASLQNKIKGLENKLGSQKKLQFQEEKSKTDHNSSNHSNRYKREDRIQKYPSNANSNQSTQHIQRAQPHNESRHSNQPIPPQSKQKSYIGEKQQKDNQENKENETSESESTAYQSFPLRLKKQYIQQQQDIQQRRQDLNERFNTQTQPQIRERFEQINDSPEEIPIQVLKSAQVEMVEKQKKRLKSLTDSDQDQNKYGSDKENIIRSDDSTISVNENIKKRLRQKVDQYKHGRKSSTKRKNSQGSLSASLKRSNTQDITILKKVQTKVKRQVRFSENKRKSRDSSSSGSRIPVMDLPQELLELRKQNAYLKMEIDKLKKNSEHREDHYAKLKELRHEFKGLQEDFRQNEVVRKEQKEIIKEQKAYISQLKKKVKKYKEKVRRLKGEETMVSEHHGTATHTKHNSSNQPLQVKANVKTYKQFKNEEQKPKSQRKVAGLESQRKRSKSQKQKKL